MGHHMVSPPVTESSVSYRSGRKPLPFLSKSQETIFIADAMTSFRAEALPSLTMAQAPPYHGLRPTTAMPALGIFTVEHTAGAQDI